MAGFLATNEGLFQTILVYALLAASVQIVMRAGVFSLASIGFWAVGGYLCANLVKVYHVNYLLAIAVTLVVCGVLGWLLALPRSLALVAVGLLTAALLTVLRKWTTNQDRLRRAAAPTWGSGRPRACGP